jgi:protein-S-isoprenylcysteine O-methyltransferase Ste14
MNWLLNPLNLHWISIVLWLTWLALWILAARGSRQAERSEGALSRSAHLAVMGTAFALLYAPPFSSGLARAWWPTRLASVGLFVQTGGFALALAARKHLGRNWSGSVQLKVEHEVVQNGPYALVRHPIYGGLLTAILGSAAVAGHLQGLLALPLMLAAYLRKIGMEERLLIGALGQKYESYRQRTKALVPFLL